MPAKEDKKAFRCYGGKRLDCRRGKTKNARARCGLQCGLIGNQVAEAVMPRLGL